MTCFNPALALRVARAIHERQSTPNCADQLRKDMAAAYELLETLQVAGLVVANNHLADSGVSRGSLPHGQARSSGSAKSVADHGGQLDPLASLT